MNWRHVVSRSQKEALLDILTSAISYVAFTYFVIIVLVFGLCWNCAMAKEAAGDC